MSKEVEEQKTLIFKALEEYKADKTSAKPLFESMKEISSWLLSKGNS